MNAMTLAGRRGEIFWGKGLHLTGEGRRQYDAYLVGFGFFVPLVLRELVHVWDIPTTQAGSCKGIRLRPDSAFKTRVLWANWGGTGAAALLIATPFAWAGIHPVLGIVALLGGIGLGVAALLFSREGSRNREIRLLLGRHTWGSSDPATWHTTICKDIIAPQTLQIKDYATLARIAMGKRRWSVGMWAARLCTAVENQDEGERLTDAILAEAEVRQGLGQIRSNPTAHETLFGKAYPLEKWIVCNPATHVFQIQ